MVLKKNIKNNCPKSPFSSRFNYCVQDLETVKKGSDVEKKRLGELVRNRQLYLHNYTSTTIPLQLYLHNYNLNSGLRIRVVRPRGQIGSEYNFFIYV